MKTLLKSLIRQKWINILYHLPRAFLANVIYGFPTKNLTVIGVTGTDGKTTTTNMIYKILTDAGKKVSMVSTINAVVGGKEYDTGFHVTSPDPFMVQQFAKKAVEHGDEYLLLEVTSHALDQSRFWGINFKIGVVTNITHDHLDYHKSWENYFLTKAKLIQNVEIAVLNAQEQQFKRLSKMTVGNVVTFGATLDANFNPQNTLLKLQLPGEYNVMNGLAAAAVCESLGVTRKQIQSSLENFDSLVGRMQEVKNTKKIKIFIDFAHTPNGLENALKTLRGVTKKRLVAVFGAAGERDVSKRPLMGKIAQKLSDIVILTAEDPRGQLEVINQQIMAGAKQVGGVKGKNLFVVDNRLDAIEFAINTVAKSGDIVGIFGKGHEKSMNVDGKRERPWSDEEAVKKVLWMKKSD